MTAETKVNHEMCSKENGQVIIVQKNVAATAVADLVESDLAEIVMDPIVLPPVRFN